MPRRTLRNLRIFTVGNVLAAIAGMVTGHLALNRQVIIPVMRFTLASVYEMMPFVSVLFMITIVIVAVPHTRRVAIAEYHWSRENAPKWLTPAIGVALAIPGPQDEIVIALIIIGWVLVNSQRRHAVSLIAITAWHG